MNGEPIGRKIEYAVSDILELWQQSKVTCIIIILFFVIPLGFAAYEQFVVVPKLNAAISQKQQQLETLQTSLKKAENDKDKVQSQLTPFVAAAERIFPNGPPDQRLELLAKFGGAISRFQEAAGKSSPDRILEPELKNTLVTNLKAVPPLEVEITCVLGDAEGFALASQIKDVFGEAGWKVNDVNQAPTPVRQLNLLLGKTPSPELQQALLPLSNSFGEARKPMVDDKLGEGNLKIVVGSK